MYTQIKNVFKTLKKDTKKSIMTNIFGGWHEIQVILSHFLRE